MIRIANLGKRFKLYARPSDRLVEWLTGGRVVGHNDFWALEDFSLQVDDGECVGIIGPNGAGKSTLLKMLSGTLSPTVGAFAIDGRALSLLDLGAGLNPDLTGRQNVVETAAMLGFSPADVRARLPAIEEFAALGDFFDRPLKIYSAGMSVRLAFATFVSMSPDVFIVDEILSVGDARFQRRCYQRLEEMLARGTTCLFVSHDQAAVTRFCHRGVVLANGRKVFEGSPRDACNVLNKMYFGEIVADETMDYGDGSAAIEEIWFEDDRGNRVTYAASCQPVVFCYRVRFHADAPEAVCGFHVKTMMGVEVMLVSSDSLGQDIGPVHAGDELTLRWYLNLNLTPNTYFFGCGCRYASGQRFMARRVDAIKFPVVDRVTVGGIVNAFSELKIDHRRAAGERKSEADHAS